MVSFPLLARISSSLSLLLVNSRLYRGKYGCKHYRRKCMIRASCCNQIFDCHLCHNEHYELFMIETEEPLKSMDVEKVICFLCKTEQPVGQICTNCGVKFGEYFCEICKLCVENMPNMFHCNDCKHCRRGVPEKLFHCNNCGSCYDLVKKADHYCQKDAARGLCSVCFENNYNSPKSLKVLPCGHIIHFECFKGMLKYGLNNCPLCFKVMPMAKHKDLMTTYDVAIKLSKIVSEALWKTVRSTFVICTRSVTRCGFSVMIAVALSKFLVTAWTKSAATPTPKKLLNLPKRGVNFIDY